MKVERRGVLAKFAAALGGVVLLRSLRSERALAQGETVFSQQVPQVPVDPTAAAWEGASPVEIPLSPQLVVKPRTYEASVSSVKVRSLYDEAQVGFLLEWGDQGDEKGIGKTTSYRDAVALQFPADPAKSIPYFAMGQPGNPVVLYHWKADWQFGPDYDVSEEYPGMFVDYYPFSGKTAADRLLKKTDPERPEALDYGAKTGPAPVPPDKAFIPSWWAGNPLGDPELKRRTPVEKLTATGFGSLTSVKEQDGQGKGVRQGQGWRVVVAVPRRQGAFEFSPGQVVPVNFAVWDGQKGERGGEKAVSTWNWLALEKSVGATPFLLPAALMVAVGILEWAIVRRLRRPRRPVAPSSLNKEVV